jgi:hypothetical protein
MIALLCGGREYFFTPEDYVWLDAFADEHNVTELVTGGATGADANGQVWASRRGIETVIFPANWRKHGRSAGFKRNKRMLTYLQWAGMRDNVPVGVIAMPGGVGTRMMCSLAHRDGVMVYAPGTVVAYEEHQA